MPPKPASSDVPSTASLEGARVFLGAAYLGAGMGGISRVARLTARTLAESGCQTGLLSLLDEQPTEFPGRATHSVARGKASFVAQCQLAALRYRHFIYDQAGLGRGHPSVFPLRRPLAVWMHGIEIWEALRPDARAVLERADMRFINSEFSLQRYRELHGDNRDVSVCWLATEEDEPPGAGCSFEGPPTALLLARVDEIAGFKGHAEIIEVWPEVIAAVPDARLVFAGGGAGVDRLREAVALSPVADSIDVKGFVPEGDLPELFRSAHAFVMPSRKEGFGLVYIEAMRYGLPVIASIHDAGQEVNVDGETGYNVDLDKADTLKDALIALLANTDHAAAMGRAGQARWAANFRFRAFVERFQPLVADFVRSTP